MSGTATVALLVAALVVVVLAVVWIALRATGGRATAEERARQAEGDAERRRKANEILAQPIPHGAALRARMRARWVRLQKRLGNPTVPSPGTGGDSENKGH